MAQGKQAKVLSDTQVKTALLHLQNTRNGERDTVMFLFSVKGGLRAKEIASLTWAMVTDAEGEITDAIYLENVASKGRGGRTIPMNRDLKCALQKLKVTTTEQRQKIGFEFDIKTNVIKSERASKMTPNSVAHWFKRLYENLGYDGCSSHSGRRSAITKWAKNVSKAGGSLRDVQDLAGHSSLATTQRYIQSDTEAKRKLVNLA